MINNVVQPESYRWTKTPDEVYKIALPYQRGDKFATSYTIFGGGLHTALGGALQVKAEPISSIRGGFRNPFQRGSSGHFRGKTTGGAERRCFICDQANFTTEHISKRPARNAACNYCKKRGHNKRPCRGKKGANRGRVGLIHGETDGDDQFAKNDVVDHFTIFR